MLSLLRKLNPAVYPPGTLLIQERMPNTRLYFVSAGVVSVWKNFENFEMRELVATLEKNRVSKGSLPTATTPNCSCLGPTTGVHFAMRCSCPVGWLS